MTPMEQGGLQFVAKPVLHVQQPMVPGPSARKLTVPVSPRLQTASRSHIRPPTAHSAQGK